MRTKQLLVAGFWLAGSVNIYAQTILATPASTQVVSNPNVGSGNSVYIGAGAGNTNTSPSENVVIGRLAGTALTTNGTSNVFVGAHAGRNTTSGTSNIFTGVMAGYTNLSGSYNIFSGFQSGFLATGSSNIMIGHGSGFSNTGTNNVFIGHQSGGSNTGSNNVFIGGTVGASGNVSNQLHIDNSNVANPLIQGDFNLDELRFHGKVGIGAFNSAFGGFPANAAGVAVSNYRLYVRGGILADGVRIANQTTWADYVFEDDYKLRPLAEVECFIDEHGHLPNIPSAEQVKSEGIDLADMARMQQEKIEELTLYIIQLNKEVETLKAKVDSKK